MYPIVCRAEGFWYFFAGIGVQTAGFILYKLPQQILLKILPENCWFRYFSMQQRSNLFTCLMFKNYIKNYPGNNFEDYNKNAEACKE